MSKMSQPEENFKPSGTIAFVILLLLLTGLIWYAIYFLEVQRHIQ